MFSSCGIGSSSQICSEIESKRRTIVAGLINKKKNLTMDQAELRKRLRHLLAAYMGNRKLVAITILAFLCILYFFPSWFGFGAARGKSDSVAARVCLAEQLRHYYQLEKSFQVHTQHLPPDSPSEKAYIPFVGNGRLGLTLGGADENSKLYVASKRVLSQAVDFYPVIRAQLSTGFSAAFVSDYQKGSIKKIQCYAFEKECVTVISSLYVHRRWPSLIVQDIQVNNPLDRSIEVALFRRKNGWTATPRTLGEAHQTNVLTSSVQVEGGTLAMAAIMNRVPSNVSVKGRRQENIRFITVIDYSDPIVSSKIAEYTRLVADNVTAVFAKISKISTAKLDNEHEKGWLELNKATLGLSFSMAPETLNANLINATRYAVLANLRAPLLETEIEAKQHRDLSTALAQSELCYTGHSTLMVPSSLWQSMTTVDELIKVAETWILTLEKNGCMHLVRAGATGAAQAMLLSFGPFKFSHHHLEFGENPSELHRDYTFSNILLDAVETTVTVDVEVGPDNKAILYASIQKSVANKRVFACDAGCLDSPVELKESRTQFPVKLTQPLTPILYVATDRGHLEDLKHTIHVKEVGMAPAHDHHVIALHKHGHRLGGLPTLFWVTLAFLIVAFHLFLIKLVYNEWLRTEPAKTHSSYYGRNRYVS